MQLEDTLEQQEEEEPKATREESSEDETQQQVNQQIRFTPITPTLQIPTMSTTITQATYTRVNDDLDNPDDHPNKPTTLSKHISGSLRQFLRRTGPPGGGGPPGDDPDEWEHPGRRWAGGGPPGSSPPGGGPPGGAGHGADLIPVAIAGDVKTMGSLPQIFIGDCTRADDFIEEVQGYLCLNQDVAGFNSPMKKVSLTLTVIKGPEVAGWVRDMGRWIDQLDPVINNVPLVWEQFLHKFAQQFQDSQCEDRARIKIENLHTKFPDINEYISQFEEMARQAGYTQGSPETTQLFLKGLTKSVLEDVLKPPFPHGYQAIKERAIESTKSKQLIDSIINRCPNQGGSTGSFQRPNNGGFQGGAFWNFQNTFQG